jgi:hypothetical protein
LNQRVPSGGDIGNYRIAILKKPIDRTDGHPRSAGNGIHGRPVDPNLIEEPASGCTYRLEGSLTAMLLRSRPHGWHPGHGHGALVQLMMGRSYLRGPGAPASGVVTFPLIRFG